MSHQRTPEYKITRPTIGNGARVMSIVDTAIQTQLKNIQTRTGKTLEQLFAHIEKSGLAKHNERIAFLKTDFGLGHGDANMLALAFKKHLEAPTAEHALDADPADAFYSGQKAALRPIHDKLMKAIEKIGPFEISPKKNYLSLRRKKQFAMIGPATNTRVEVGLNMKGVDPTDRLIALPPGGMCQYRVVVTATAEVDKELLGWLKQAYLASE